ncbi:MAG: hypothetical protein Q9225_001356 [Loekoesia sp. 1 TL-2023]
MSSSRGGSKRGDQYSTQEYHWYHFTGEDYNNENKRTAIYRILGDGKNWSNSVNKKKGDYDYLLCLYVPSISLYGIHLFLARFVGVDYNHPEVEADVKAWSEWLCSHIPIKGIRFDAIKHFSEEFLKSLVEHLDPKVEPGWFLVSELWEDFLEATTTYMRNMQHKFSLFDAPLVYNFSQLSNRENADLTKVFDDTLVKSEPVNAGK